MTSSIPAYTPEENVTRIQMETDIKFIVVEGVDDVPIYESVIHSILPDNDLDFWDVIHVGGKSNIKALIEHCNSSNFICIADKDFDEKITSDDVICLPRYSLENFLICEEAISAALAISLRKKYKDILELFDLNAFYQEVENGAKKLLIALFYYHRNIASNEIDGGQKWNNVCIHKHLPDWGVSETQVEALIYRLIPPEVTEEEMVLFFDSYFEQSGRVAFDLPGKMLKVLLQRYVYNFYKSEKRKGGGQFSSPDSFSSTISGVLNRSPSFVELLEPVLNFINENAVA